MSRQRERRLERLDELESAFRSSLVRELERCARGEKSNFFHASHLVPSDWPRCVHCRTTDELLERSAEIRRLREQLGLDPDEGLGPRFERECANNMDLADDHRLGARRRAEVWLAELREA